MNYLEEIWKSLDGLDYCDFIIYGYEISNLGRIRSADRFIIMKNGIKRFHKGKIRNTKFNNRGYEMVTISVSGKEKTCLIHRLVAMTFIPNISSLPEVNHKDNDKSNNCILNLEWITSKDNHAHAVKEGFRNQSGQNGINSKLKNEDVIKIRKLYNRKSFNQRELAEIFDVSQSSIGRIIRRDSYKDIYYA